MADIASIAKADNPEIAICQSPVEVVEGLFSASLHQLQ